MIYDLLIGLVAVGCVGSIRDIDELLIGKGLANRFQYRKATDPRIKYSYGLLCIQGMVNTTLPMV